MPVESTVSQEDAANQVAAGNAAGPRAALAAGRQGLADWCREQGWPEFRARQIWDWIVRRRAVDAEAMTDLPKAIRERFAADWSVFAASVAAQHDPSDDTAKLLLRWPDGHAIECVLLREEERRTVCLSTQVGCAMGCVFCASGLNGVARNLTAAEMCEQLLRLRNLLPAAERLSHIVVMGMGEPTANLENLLPALAFATAADGLGISARHVTISTVGMPAKIRKLAAAGRPYHLAVSLHAPNAELRQRIVPTARKVDLGELLAAADEYRSRTGRQVTFEYVLLADLNDRPEHAAELASLLAGRDALVNLIPYNPVAGLPYRTPAPERSRGFARRLREAGFTVKLRKRKGAEIDAACGQLRRSAADAGLVQLG